MQTTDKHHQRPAGRLRTASLALLALFIPLTAWAATITVDGFDSTVADDGVCTLREAITAADADTASGASAGECPAGSGADTVALSGNVTLTAVDNTAANGPNGLPVVTTELIVDGAGFTVARSSGGPDFRFFEASPSADLTLESVTLTGGSAGGFSRGGAVVNDQGTVTLRAVTLSGNVSDLDGFGGGIGVVSGGYTEIIDSTIAGNSATFGGGVDSADRIVNSTIAGNDADLGGGIFSVSALINSTVSGNSADPATGTGGGIFSATAIENSVIVGNSAGLYAAFLGVDSMRNSIVGGNVGPLICGGVTNDLGGNFSDDPACGFAAITPGVDYVVTLANNGGPTRTHALLPGSVALDDAGACAGNDPALVTDQRGEPRPSGAACDSGAFELQVASPEPELQVAELIPGAELETVDVGVELTTGGAGVAATTFSIDYDEGCLAFDEADGDADNIPDAIAFSVPGDFAVSAVHSSADPDGEIDVSIADLNPADGVATLPDGTLLTVTLTSTCSPAVDATVVAAVAFSDDPAATFSGPDAVDVNGTTSDGSVEIWPGPRGDCNRTGALSAADLIADALEIFDDDGDFWADVVGSDFPGSPVGCDANADTSVDAGDISCTVLLIFGGTCGGSPFAGQGVKAFDAETSPLLGLGRARRGEDGVLWIPVGFSAGSHAISSVAFSLDLADRGLVFDPTDGDGDGVPDAVRFPGGRPGLVQVRYDAADRSGELDLAIATFDGVFGDGGLIEIALRPRSWRGWWQRVRFADAPAASFGDLSGQAVPGRALDGGLR